MRKKFYFETIIICFIVLLNGFLCTKDPDIIKRLTMEDGIVETCQAILYFLSGCILIFLFIRSKNKDNAYFFKTKRNFFLLLLGFICLFAAGEEISWGQRILNINTPDYFMQNNEQNELNIHNLRLFQGKIDGEWKTGIKYLLNSQYIAYLFFFTFLLLIPVFSKYSVKIRMFFKNIFFPITPLWIGLTLLICTLILETIKRMGFVGYFQIGEIKELNYALLLFTGVISLLDRD